MGLFLELRVYFILKLSFWGEVELLMKPSSEKKKMEARLP